MPVSLKNRHFLTLKDFTQKEIQYLLDLSTELKKKKQEGMTGDRLKGKNIVIIFEKSSTRTRCAFEVAVYDEGGHVTFLTNSQMGKKESIEDTAKVLGRFYDGIEFRGFRQETVEALARYSGVPVWNGLTDLYHPTQILADFLTALEHTGKPLSETRFAFVGDGRFNMANSFLIGCAKMGAGISIVAPKELFPQGKIVEEAKNIAAETGSEILITDDIAQGVLGADVVYTDVWFSMGEEDQIEARIEQLKPYQVNSALMEKTGNPNTLFMHCLPAFHDQETEVGRMVAEKYGLKEMEVTDGVFRSSNSVVFDEAENRMHTIKAVMVATAGREEL